MAQKNILLVALNARYHHSSFGLRYLYANLKELQSSTQVIEFTISQNTRDIVESVLKFQPQIIGFGVYIWNTRQTCEVISMLKKINPKLVIVLGGPEVSYETKGQEICEISDYVFIGESEFLFYTFCKNFVEKAELPLTRIIQGELPNLDEVASPYPYYSDEDIRHRVIYVEASRGCPYKCEYCLSSLDKSVRGFHLERFLTDMSQLIEKGARSFKFVDRTFNLSISTSTRILEFFLERIHLGLFLHFEMVPDRLPPELKALVSRFPKGTLQFEIGIQTWSPDVAKLVSRRQDYRKIADNFKFLTEETGVHIHADLIVGLPGETLESFARGFDSLSQLNPHEIQVGLLKRLKGTPIIRHDAEWEMLYQEHPPFQILQTKTMDFGVIQKLGRFSHFWDLIANSGNFINTMKFLKEMSLESPTPSLFEAFFNLSQYLSEKHPQGNGVSLLSLVETVWNYLTLNLKMDPDRARSVLVSDYSGKIKRDIPHFLRANGSRTPTSAPTSLDLNLLKTQLPKRQNKHLGLSL